MNIELQEMNTDINATLVECQNGVKELYISLGEVSSSCSN